MDARRFLFFALLIAFPAVVPALPPALIFVSDDFPPYAYEENGRVEGYSVDVVDAVCRRLGIEAEFRIYPWRRALLMAERGAADGVINVSHLASREHFLAYTENQRAYDRTGVPTDHLWCSEYVFFVNRFNVSELAGLDYERIAEAGYRVGVNRDFAYENAFREAPLQRVVHTTPSESLTALAARELDLFACDRSIGLWLVDKLGLQEKVTFIPKPLFEKPYLAVFAKNSRHPMLPELTSRFYHELEAFKDTEAYAEICLRYQIRNGQRHPRPLIFVCENWQPFEYEKDGVPFGLNVEVVERVMGRIGVPYEIRVYPWRRAWRMVEQAAADAVLSVSYHPEREAVLYFTDEQRQFETTGEAPPDFLWMSEYFFFVKQNFLDRFTFDSFPEMAERGYRIGINRSYTYSPEFPFNLFQRKEFNCTRDGFLALVAEEIDLYPMDRTVGLAELKEMGLLESVTYIPKRLFAKPYLAPFSKRSDYPGLAEIMQAFNRELRLMRESGEYEEIYQRHCGSIPPAPQTEGRP